MTVGISSMRWLGAALACLLLVPAGAGMSQEGREVVRWNRAPITISLPVGQERFIWFPGRVQPGVPPDLMSKLRVQAVDDTIYLTANEDFETTRLPVRDLTTGSFYLLDLRTSADAPTTPLQVIEAAGDDEEAFTSATGEADDSSADSIGYVRLTRFAAQQIHAPKRLTRQEPGIYDVPLPAEGKFVEDLFLDRVLSAQAVASWRGSNGLYVTAVTVQNTTSSIVELDPRQARGQWLTATFHHPELQPSGKPNDRSTLYLISDRPFQEAVGS